MDDPLWYKDAIIYEVHVRAFQDGNHDGIGDFVGLTQRLEYLADLGITAIWLLPFAPSPLKDDGYDTADYTNVHPSYGTLDDFRTFLDKAHSLGMQVITELVINHTSDQHPWFQRARRAPAGSPERNFYVWSDDPDRYAGVPLMFPDFESSNWAWDPIARQYYWHRFYSHQPDLNFDNPEVWNALLPVVDFWFEMGVDGMRLDAVPYLIEREGTACEHLPETHAFLKALRKHVDARFPNRMFLAEANAWPDDMVAYFGDGDECQMAFHFPLMPRLFMALHQENRFSIADILAQTPAIPKDCQWCLFLRNHDELTLAMVTDEERDAMYTAYARDRQARLFLGIRHRLAPLLKNDRRRIELMNAILFSLPGTPVLYYGDEIGMGDNIYLGDRNGVRTPMQWSDDRNAGFSRANSQRLYLPVIIDSEYHYEAVNVETQQNNPSSLLWWTKRLIALRKRHPAFGRGTLRLLEPENAKVLAYVRQTESECLLIVANLSRFVQNVQLNLNDYAGLVPEEMFGRTQFPAIKAEGDYGLTLGPHGFYWFSLVPQKVAAVASNDLPLLAIRDWSDAFRGKQWEILSSLLIARHSTGFRPTIVGCRLVQSRPIPLEGLDARVLVCRLEDSNGLFETLFQPLALVPEERFQGADGLPEVVAIARTGPPRNAILCDPIVIPEYVAALLAALKAHKVVPLGDGADLVCTPWDGLAQAVESLGTHPTLSAHIGEQHRLTVILDRQLVLRMFRRPDEGVNPDVEIGKYLQDQGFTAFAEVIGTIEYRRAGSDSTTLGAVHRYVQNHGDAWQLMLDEASRFFDGVAAQSPAKIQLDETIPAAVPTSGSEYPNAAAENWEHYVSPFLESARAIATFTAHLHQTLGMAPSNSPIAAIPATPAFQRSFYQSLRNATGRLQSLLSEASVGWPAEVQMLAVQVRDRHAEILGRIHSALDPMLVGGQRIRCHGDYHLGQLLVSGQGFILSDFEGPVDRPISERRIKRSPLYDVAAMIRSFDYAASTAMFDLTDKPNAKRGVVRAEDRDRLQPYRLAWLDRLQHEFATVYFREMDSSGLLPASETARRQLLALLSLERAFREAEHDLVDRPEWARISLSAILRLIDVGENGYNERGMEQKPHSEQR